MNKIAVIGLGLIGSAAFKYLSQQSDSVIGFGVAEPPDYAKHRSVFASHYDNGRLTYRSGQDDVWAALNQWAVAQYNTIETQSGIRFHQGHGCLSVFPNGSSSLPSATNGADVDTMDYPTSASISKAHPMFTFPNGMNGRFEAAPAGTINPRSLVQAQLTIGRQHGGEVVWSPVSRLDKSGNHFDIVTPNGRFAAERVLVAAGAFTNQLNLPPLDLKVKSEMTILVEVNAQEAQRLSPMPALIYEADHPHLSSLYMNPPQQYGNGRLCIKIGCNTTGDKWLETLPQKQEWMVNGSTAPYDNQLLNILRQMMPAFTLNAMTPKRCLVTYTAHHKPYIDQLEPNLFVAVGGNGKSAKCSDTLGFLASQLGLDKPWPAAFNRSHFKTTSNRSD